MQTQYNYLLSVRAPLGHVHRWDACVILLVIILTRKEDATGRVSGRHGKEGRQGICRLHLALRGDSFTHRPVVFGCWPLRVRVLANLVHQDEGWRKLARITGGHAQPLETQGFHVFPRGQVGRVDPFHSFCVVLTHGLKLALIKHFPLVQSAFAE